MFGPDQALGISEREEEFLLATMLEMEACRRNLVYFLERYAWTIDEHRRIDNERPLMHGAHFIDRDTLQPVRELDGSTDDYLRYAAAVWWNEDLTAYPKARQLRMTHLMVWCHGWLCMMYEGQRVAFQ
ncbi:MAG: hypothetical protein R3190_19265, partial [Thermoanaerobaculia bacterium]|nr:hypothetical protein [Thermoanaerobaculia bacterium]